MSPISIGTLGRYNLNLWKYQPWHVELWFEKDAITGVVDDIAQKHGIIMRPLRGQSSISFLNVAAKSLAEKALEFWGQDDIGTPLTKRIQIYYFGDHDPSGYSIEKSAKDTLALLLKRDHGWEESDIHWDNEGQDPQSTYGELGSRGIEDEWGSAFGFAPYQIYWQRVGIMHDDLDTYDLIRLPIKEGVLNEDTGKNEGGDTSAKKFKELFEDSSCAELDALPTSALRSRVRAACRRDISPPMWLKAGREQIGDRKRIDRGIKAMAASI